MDIEVTVDPPMSPLPNDIAVKSDVLELPEKPSIPITDNLSALEISRPIDTNTNSDLSKMESHAKDHPSYIPAQIKQEDEVTVKDEKDESRAIYGWQYSFPLLSTEEVKKSLEKCSNFLYIPPDPSISQLSRKSSKVVRRMKRSSPEVEALGICVDVIPT